MDVAWKYESITASTIWWEKGWHLKSISETCFLARRATIFYLWCCIVPNIFPLMCMLGMRTRSSNPIMCTFAIPAIIKWFVFLFVCHGGEILLTRIMVLPQLKCLFFEITTNGFCILVLTIQFMHSLLTSTSHTNADVVDTNEYEASCDCQMLIFNPASSWSASRVCAWICVYCIITARNICRTAAKCIKSEIRT